MEIGFSLVGVGVYKGTSGQRHGQRVGKQRCLGLTRGHVTLSCRGEDPSREEAVRSLQRVSRSILRTPCLLDGGTLDADAGQLDRETSVRPWTSRR